MNFTCITLHNETLNTIIDAAISNKTQNAAVKFQINRSVDELMNRISGRWLDDKVDPVDVEPQNNRVKHMVDRFLGWRLPDNFNPDGGISFKKTLNENTGHPMMNEPTGTNLLDAKQAEQMVRYIIEGMPAV